MTTGVFFHKQFRGREWLIIGDKFQNFPKAMERQLRLPSVRLFEPKTVSEDLLLRVHTQRFVRHLQTSWYCEGALLSVGGCVEATEKILSGDLQNALVFTVAAGHHAERDSAWGGTYASCAGPAMVNAREKFGRKRVAILDTDRHHGNGTRDIFLHDSDVLHVCFCSWDRVEGDNTKICVNIASPHTDDAYMEKVEKEFISRAREFEPDMILHNLGHDTCELDYGDIGLTEAFFPRLTELINRCAREVCQGRYLVLTHGGSRKEVAESIFPKIIEILAGT
jgi:acetoin utilization deacetylase AcuC-like enzyme